MYPPRSRRPGTLDTNATDVAIEFYTTNDERTRYFGTVLCNEINVVMDIIIVSV